MQQIDQAAFQEEVIQAAFQMQLYEGRKSGRNAFQSEDQSEGELEDELRKAELRIKQPEILRRICPVLNSVAADIEDIAKEIVPVLLPLAVGVNAVISSTPMAFGALAYVVARAGIAALCGGAQATER